MRLLTKVPIPVPLTVKLFANVGLEEVLKQTPLAVTADPPSELTVPPVVAVVVVIFNACAVETVGNTGFSKVEKVCWAPYEVPALLVAKARTR